MDAVAPPSRRLFIGMGVVLMLNACGPAPPDAATLLRQSSQRMTDLKGFHFHLQIGGFTGSGEPVQSADGDAHPPDLHAKVNLKQAGFLVEVDTIFAAAKVYLKSFTGGYQQLTEAQVAEFFDPRSLFDPQAGLFAAMRETMSPSRGNVEKVNGHDAYPVDGKVSANRMHLLLSLIRDEGSYRVTYWIDNPGNNLWRARLAGNLFDASQPASITFDFSNHDHSVSVTPPPLG